MDKQREKELLGRCGLLKLEDETQWPDPTDEVTHTAMWRMLHARENVTEQDMKRVHRMAEAYHALVTHPAFTLKVVQQKVSGIRKAIKS